MKKKKAKITQVIYLGERILAHSFGSKPVHLYREEKGEAAYFSRAQKWAVPGDVYFMTDEKLPRDLSTVRVPEEKIKLTWTDQEQKDYEIHKELCKDWRLRRSKMMNISKPHADIVCALKLLRPFCGRMDFITLERFTKYLVNQLSKKGKR